MKSKQILVIRKDLKLRRGKEAAQLSHASMAILFNLIKKQQGLSIEDEKVIVNLSHNNEALQDFLRSNLENIQVAYVNSEEELLSLHKYANDRGILSSLIKDAGLTELKEPTFTAIAIGPDWEEIIDEVVKDRVFYGK